MGGAMKKICIVAALMLLIGLSGCHGKEDYGLTGIIFDRGHDSAWGNQLYMQVCSTQIVSLRYIAKDTGQLETLEHIPIRPEQWEALKSAVLHLDLQKDTVSWKERFFGRRKLDGGAYRNLSLIYSSGGKETTTKYQWPESSEAQELEAMLGQLAQSATEHPADNVHPGRFAVAGDFEKCDATME